MDLTTISLAFIYSSLAHVIREISHFFLLTTTFTLRLPSMCFTYALRLSLTDEMAKFYFESVD
jgi:hypothetical protein